MIRDYMMNRDRNLKIEKRISATQKKDISLGINSYGGMGMDSCSVKEKQKRQEEINYMNNHTYLYQNAHNKYTEPKPFSLFADIKPINKK